jgi:hypothetical protein
MNAARVRSWVVAVAAVALLAPVAARALPQNVPSVPVQDGAGTDAVFEVTAFYAKGNQVWATGVLHGLVNGEEVTTIASAPVEGLVGAERGGGPGGGPGARGFGGISTQQAVCDVLNLDLGPLHLDLLGLVIDLNDLHLDIVAQPGSGNLLGNLLCAIVGLFDGAPSAGLATQLSALLNSLLGLLG